MTSELLPECLFIPNPKTGEFCLSPAEYRLEIEGGAFFSICEAHAREMEQEIRDRPVFAGRRRWITNVQSGSRNLADSWRPAARAQA